MRASFQRVLLLLAASVCVRVAPAWSQVHALDWTAFSVKARLDSTGRLFVREQQTILFTGDWNGGERKFDVRMGQQFVFRRLLRLDSLTGAEVALHEGSTDEVDGYKMGAKHTVRWRSRLPGDPPFENTKITYILEYEYSDILRTEGQQYRLNHEFGFRERTGTIANFDLTLDLDRAWRAPAGFTGHFAEPVMRPGLGYVVDIPLTWRGAGAPDAVRQSPPIGTRIALAAAVLCTLIVTTVRFLREEAAGGRFVPLLPLARVDAAWLRSTVLSMRPEVAGYAWDEHVGEPEVAATLARLIAEKKLASRVESSGASFLRRNVLHLELLVPRGDLQGYEKALVDGFFAPNANTTSTVELRERYKRTGFDPARILRQPLAALFEQTSGIDAPRVVKKRWPLTAGLCLAAVALLTLALFTRETDGVLALVAAGIVAAPCFVVARIQSALWQRRVVHPARHLVWTLLPMTALTAGLCWLLATGYRSLGLLATAGLSLLVIALYQSVLNGARSKSTKARLLLRKDLAVAREYCRTELQKPTPALSDDWYPYCLAFGLGRHVDKWFRAFGPARTPTHSGSGLSTRTSSTSPSSGSSDGTFAGFGGGGGFSGAGATVAFSSAVSAMAAGVSAPSSSGSGGSSSSSGGSSGGGGGGGW